MIRSAKKLLLIGWDAADWRIINPLLDEGKMPNLRRLVEGGTIGNIATIEPVLSPLLWTSISTGKRPYKHGVLGFTEVDPSSGAIRPVTTLGRKTKAIWNILTQEKKRCNIVGWWPTHPAEPINGVMVSNEFQTMPPPLGEPWNLPPGSVYPERLRDAVADLRLNPQELTHEHLGPFVPRWQEIDREKDVRLNALATILAECSSVHATATAVMQLEPWDFMGIYYNAIDQFCHHFMHFHPPRCDGVPEREFDLYKEVLAGAYRYHDLMLGTLMSLAGEDTAIILISDHGFRSDESRNRPLPDEPAAIANDHRRFGIFAMSGPGIKKDERIYGVSILDVTPTILHFFGLPVGQDMDGKPLVAAFEEPAEVHSVPSWDAIPGADGSHPPGQKIDNLFAAQSLKQLAALGYIAEPNENAARAIDETNTELEYNLARAYMDGREYAQASTLLAKLYERRPQQHRFGIQLAYCHKALNQPLLLKSLVDTMIARRQAEAEEAKASLAKILEPDGKPIDISTFDERQRAHIAALERKASTNFFTLEFLLGYVELSLGNPRGALKHLDRAKAMDSKHAGLHLQLGQVYLRLREWAAAEECFQNALALDSDSSAAQLGLCRCYLVKQEFYQAVKWALASVGLVHFNPYAHFLLGVALEGFGSFNDAVNAFKVALAQEPAFPAAHRWLARIYEKHLGDSTKAEEHRRRGRELLASRSRSAELLKAPAVGPLKPSVSSETAPIFASRISAPEVNGAGSEDVITIVSGLPRSGTSLMMQMLAAGGLPILTDNLRQPDENNPNGFLEFEKVKELHRDQSWVAEAKGKCVKIVAPLLPFLPGDLHYRVILMSRPLAEVSASQEKMLARKGESSPAANPAALHLTFEQQFRKATDFLESRRIPFMVVPYHDCLNSTATICQAVNDFLGADLNQERMRGAVDPKLYRNRSAM